MLTKTQFSTPNKFKKKLSLSSVSTINLKDVSFDKTPKNCEEVISNTGLCLFYSCLFFFLYNVSLYYLCFDFRKSVNRIGHLA